MCYLNNLHTAFRCMYDLFYIYTCVNQLLNWIISMYKLIALMDIQPWHPQQNEGTLRVKSTLWVFSLPMMVKVWDIKNLLCITTKYDSILPLSLCLSLKHVKGHDNLLNILHENIVCKVKVKAFTYSCGYITFKE